MSIVRYVAFYPPTGWEDRPWLDDPACDALVKTARRVGELYSKEVARLRLVGKASEVRFFAEEAQADVGAVGVNVHVDFLGGFEAVRVSVPRAVAGLEPRERAELVLEVLHRSMLVLAPYRGWSVEALLSAEASARARQLEFRFDHPVEGQSRPPPRGASDIQPCG